MATKKTALTISEGIDYIDVFKFFYPPTNGYDFLMFFIPFFIEIYI
jgi:hypothetical protein